MNGPHIVALTPCMECIRDFVVIVHYINVHLIIIIIVIVCSVWSDTLQTSHRRAVHTGIILQMDEGNAWIRYSPA